MAIYASKQVLLCILLFSSSLFSLSYGSSSPSFRVRAVNLGGWLVTEGWIKPSLFDGIHNKDLLDGTHVHFKSVTTRKYLSAKSGGGSIIVANRAAATDWETFRLWRINATTFQFRVHDNHFVGLDTARNGIDIVAVSTTPGSHKFQIVRRSGDSSRVRIKAPNGFYLQAKSEELVTADYKGDGGWGDDDPSVFAMSSNVTLQGDFQITNGYGPEMAPRVMREHWRTFIVEKDFKFIASNGLNAVRIPVGWWIASDPRPPKPYVGGSLKALDRAFSWAEKYDIKVIIDLHAAPNSQNGFEHSSSRDGSQEWGETDQSIKETVAVIDFLTARYAKHPSLYAVELLNEPLAPGTPVDTVLKYYRDGYNAVRKHSSKAYVVMSSRIGPVDAREILPLASGLNRTVIDVHYYNLFWPAKFDGMNVQQNIDFINNDRSAELNLITTANGPLILIGEWVVEWQVKNATKEDYQRFAAAQLKVWERATFGWAYWTLKNVDKHWSLEWMIKNRYIKL